ncbi:MAG: DHA2 family efflux MFS transporter permease subunit [Solirubrobacteraceae bacterium]
MSGLTVSAAPPASLPASRVRLIFAGLMLVLLLAALDQTIVATALPTIVSDLGGLNHLSWVTSAFLLGQTAVTPIYGKLGDLYGRKRVLQSAVALFLLGSILCGLSDGMTELIAFRAVQGLGAGGLIVLTQAVIGDVVPPRERGKYQGLFGAVFGVASIAGPLLGGVIVQAVSWRWIFYVNVPLGLVAVIVLGATLPSKQARGRPAIDYVGASLLAAALSAIVLVASLGGTTWPWGSAQTILVAAAGVLLLAAFIATERRAREPVLPLELLSNRVFRIGGILSLIVGFALFGSVTFLPLYFQTVDAASPSAAGLRLTPMMAGLLVTSILSGQLIARRGRYRIFPIVGTAVMVVGLALLSRLDVGTSAVQSALYLLVLGIGLGMTMQVLVLAVQNAVDYQVLGAATSGVTLFRGLGGSLGAAVFGTIFSSRLTSGLRGLSGATAHQVAGAGRLTGAQVARLPPATRAAYEHAYVHALRPVFVAAAGVALVGALISWLLPERPLRETAATSRGLEDSLAAPRSPDSLAEIERALSCAVTPEERERFRQRLAERAGVDLSPGATWALVRISEYGIAQARAMAEDDGVPAARIAAVVEELRTRGLVARDGAGVTGGGAALTADGRSLAQRAVSARRTLLDEALADEQAERDPAVEALLHRLAQQLAGEPPVTAPDAVRISAETGP